MTVEIKQLVIRAVVEAPSPSRATLDVAAPSRPLAPAPAPVDVDAIVDRCTREVLRKLERRRGRR